jgi:GDSL-like Lipase/Acylhydrolase family
VPFRLCGKQRGRRHVAAVAILVAAALAGCEASGPAKHTATGPSATRPAAAKLPPRPSPTAAATPLVSRTSGAGPRIMIVGDSITQGSAGDYTWQYWLYEHLLADGVRPRMVGPYGWLYNNVTNVQGDHSYANPDFEHANDAFWGLTLMHEKDVIGDLATTYRPAYLLVLLGLNDLFWDGISQPGMAENLAGFIAAARAAQPRIRIVLGLIPPDIHERASAAFAASVAAYNQTISSTASQLSTTASPIAVAHDGSGISIAADLWDGTHPNTNGQIKIAAGFADVLARRFHLGGLYPTPLPVLPTGPLIPPRLTVRPSLTAHQAVLSWTLVPGAESYYVYLKNTTKGNAVFTRLPWPLSPKQDPWTAGLLIAGDVYTFKLQACKGVDCGAYSNAAKVTAPS